MLKSFSNYIIRFNKTFYDTYIVFYNNEMEKINFKKIRFNVRRIKI